LAAIAKRVEYLFEVDKIIALVSGINNPTKLQDNIPKIFNYIFPELPKSPEQIKEVLKEISSHPLVIDLNKVKEIYKSKKKEPVVIRYSQNKEEKEEPELIL